ncbi:MAG: response regulator, partial [Pirellulaceae bacterium]
AWTADSLDSAYDCIQRAMDIDPNNLIAQAGMNWIQGVWNLAEEQIEADRLEQDRLEKERLEAERLEQERLEAERLEQERLEQERLEQERMEQERLEQERLEQEQLEAERLEQARLEAERLEQARLEQEELERLEQERLAAEQEAQQRHDRKVEEAAAENEFQADLEMDDAVVADNEYDSAEMDELAAQEQVDQAEPNVISMGFDEISGSEESYEVEQAQPDDLVLIDDKDVVSFENEASFENKEKSFADVAAEVAEEAADAEPVAEANEPAPAVENDSIDSVGNDSALAHILPTMASPENQLQESVESLVEEVRQEVTSPESVFADEPDVADAANADTPQISADGNRQPVVLAVDDSATIRKLVSLTLREQGYEVVTAADGVEALKILAEQLPDLILSDINMPRLGGYKLCKFVKKHERTASIPVIMLSGKDGVFDKMRGKMNGCDGFIGKPFETQELIETISHYLPITTS